ELAGGVVGESGKGAFLVGGKEQAGLEQGLKAVADAQDELVGVAKAAQGVAEEVGELVGEDLAGRDVVAVGEASRYDKDLVAVEQGRPFGQAVDVSAVGASADLLEGELGLGVAVGAGSAEDKNACRGHEVAWRVRAKTGAFRLICTRPPPIIVFVAAPPV